MPFRKVSSIKNTKYKQSLRPSTSSAGLKILNTKYRKTKGFTLIELLVVITIIAILIGAGTVSWTNAQKKGRDAKRKSDLKSIQQALELYYQTYGTYTTSDNISVFSIRGMKCHGAFPYYYVAWGSVFQCPPSTGPIFMQKLPKDPLSTYPYIYYYTGGWWTAETTNTYTLSAQLENTSDPDISANCDIFNHNYCVTNP